MPEGPESAKSVDFLRSILHRDDEWLTLSGASKFGERFHHVDLNLLQPAIGHKIQDIKFKGKEFFILLANDVTIHAHMMMGGTWSSEPDGKNTHFELRFKENVVFNDGPSADVVELTGPVRVQKIYYNNKRFGTFEIFTTKQQLADSWNRLAPGFLGTDLISLEDWCNRFKKFTNKKSLQAILMDQEAVCSGVGNYLYIECMWYSELKPDKKLGDLTEEKLIELYFVCKFVVEGHYSGTLKKVIYKKEVSPSGNPITSMKLGGRTVWWSPKEQF